LITHLTDYGRKTLQRDHSGVVDKSFPTGSGPTYEELLALRKDLMPKGWSWEVLENFDPANGTMFC
jgi:hypothetical protein